MSIDETQRIERFDVKTLRRFRERLQELLSQHGFAGIQVKTRNISYTDADAHITVVARVEGAETREQRALRKAASVLDLDLERAVGGMRLIGYEARRREYPFIVADEEGSRFKMTPRAAVRRFGHKPAEVVDFVPDTAITRADEMASESLPRRI